MKSQISLDNRLFGIPCREVVTYTVHSLIKHFDFFNKLGKNEWTFEKITKEFGFDGRVFDATLNYLRKEGLLEKSGIDSTKYVLTKDALRFLTREGKNDLSSFVTILEGCVPNKAADAIAFALTTGTSAKWNETESWSAAMKSGAISQRFSEGMMARGKYLSETLVTSLKDVLSDRRSLLDIGGSLGDYSGVFARNNPNLQCAVFDLPKVIEGTKRNISQRGYERVITVDGDFFSDNLPKGYDAHFYSNVLHDWTQEKVKVLLKKSHEALNPSGKIIIHGMHLNSDKTGPELAIDHSLYLSVFTEGRNYSTKEISEMLKGVGFKRSQKYHSAGGYSAIVATK